MRDSRTTEYTKAIAIKPDMLLKIEQSRGKKSKAGKLNEILELYFNKYEK